MLDDSFQVVLLCAEEDDLELVELVHLGRLHGLELQVVCGVEDLDDPYIDAMEHTERVLFVMFLSDHLSQPRALELDALFERYRKPGQHMMALPLKLSDPQSTLLMIERRLAELSGHRSPIRSRLTERPLTAQGATRSRPSSEMGVEPMSADGANGHESTSTTMSRLDDERTRRGATLRFLADLLSIG